MLWQKKPVCQGDRGTVHKPHSPTPNKIRTYRLHQGVVKYNALMEILCSNYFGALLCCYGCCCVILKHARIDMNIYHRQTKLTNITRTPCVTSNRRFSHRLLYLPSPHYPLDVLPSSSRHPFVIFVFTPCSRHPLLILSSSSRRLLVILSFSPSPRE